MMMRIYFYCNFKDNCPNLPILTMLKMLLTLHRELLQNINCNDPRIMMLVLDTRDSYGFTPFMSNFTYDVRCDISVKDTTKVNRVIGIGTTLHKFIKNNGRCILFPSISYHLTQTDVHLFSPQTYHQMHSGHYVLQGNQVTMYLPFHRIQVPVDIGRTNLPVVRHSFVTEHQRRAIGPQMRSPLAYSRLSNIDIFGDLNTIRYIQAMDISSKQIEIECEFEHHYSHFCGTYVGAPAIQNLSGPQKDLLLWNWKLIVSMYHIQEFMKTRTF